MKKNRSSIWTDGICNTLKNDKTAFTNSKYKNLKMVFFELDYTIETLEDKLSYFHARNTLKVKNTYKKFELDYFIHKTGNGIHFLSPTLIDKILYKKFMNELKDINTKCPMTCMRTKPNKYENEKDYFYKIQRLEKFPNNKKSNCLEMCNFLNSTFNTDFEGSHKGSIIKVKYPLPYLKNGELIHTHTKGVLL